MLHCKKQIKEVFFMDKRLAPILGAQFFSSLADNALLIAAIALLVSIDAPDWMTPLLRLFFTVSYIVLAAWVGVLADMWPKGRVMFVTNALKILGSLMLLVGSHPLLSYAIVGAGAAAYSPAKYGILSEILPKEKLVAANGWMEGLTVVSIILGVLFGGLLVDPAFSKSLYSFLHLEIFLNLTVEKAAIAFVTGIYAVAALINLTIANTHVRYENARFSLFGNLHTFYKTTRVIFTDAIAMCSLSVTTLFWGTGAVLQFLVLRWAEERLAMPLSQGAMLQAVVSLGIAVGAVLAARYVSIRKAFDVLWTGVAMGLAVAALSVFDGSFFPGAISMFGHSIRVSVLTAGFFMLLVGALAGLFLVPMNAVYQNRGKELLTSGQAIAVQNLAENTMILLMLGLYSLMVRAGLTVTHTMLIFGVVMTLGMFFVRREQKKRFSL